MPTLFLTSPEPLAGKTTLAAGLAQRFRASGRTVALKREADDEHAAVDSRFFGAIAGPADSAEVTIIEAPSGATAIPADARALVIADASAVSDDLVGFCKT